MEVSVIIITKNEGCNIRECVESASWAKEIIVIDAFSTDNTTEICRQYTNNVHKRVWDNFSAQRNYAISLAKEEWILSLDADEIVSTELKDEIQMLLNNSSYNSYYVPFRHYFWGRWMRHGGYYPDFKIRLFRREGTRFHGIVHEQIGNENGFSTGYLNGYLIHNTVTSYERKLEKSNMYSTMSALERFKTDGTKWIRLKISCKPVLVFSIGYFYFLGFMDGFEGLICHIHNAFAEFGINVKMWEMRKRV